MTQGEKRNKIYAYIYDEMFNKKLEKKDWYAIRKGLSKLLKDYSMKEPPRIIEKIVYKEKKVKKGYWDM